MHLIGEEYEIDEIVGHTIENGPSLHSGQGSAPTARAMVQLACTAYLLFTCRNLALFRLRTSILSAAMYPILPSLELFAECQTLLPECCRRPTLFLYGCRVRFAGEMMFTCSWVGYPTEENSTQTAEFQFVSRADIIKFRSVGKTQH